MTTSTGRQTHTPRLDPGLLMPMGASEVFLTHLYVNEKGKWIRFAEPRNVSTGGNMKKLGKAMGIKVEAVVRKVDQTDTSVDKPRNKYNIGYVYLRVSDAETKAE